MTKLHLSNTIIETLFQSGIAKFHSKVLLEDELPKNGTENYVFPDGTTSINFEWLNEKNYFLRISITTNDGIKNNFWRKYDVGYNAEKVHDFIE